MTRVAIFNDSKTVRAQLRAIVESASGFEVVLEAEDGRLAGQRVVESRADLVLMDVLVPHVDGYSATRDIMKMHPLPIVIVTGLLNPKDRAVIFSALAAGALYVTTPPQNNLQAAGFVQLLRAMAGATARTSKVIAERPTPHTEVRSQPLPVSVIAFAASAGGPQALTEILRGLPLGVLPPVLIVQHLSAQFEDSFAAWLTSTTGHPVTIASDGQRARRGEVYLAGNGRHLSWDAGRLKLSNDPPVGHFRPAATVLLGSLARERHRGVAVVLSGMGSDGAQGAQEMHKAGGYVVVQSRDSAAVWGMPGEVVRRGAANVQLPVSEIANHILAVTGLA